MYPVYSRCMTANFFCTLTACQNLLSNKKSMFKVHPYKTWLVIQYCHVWDVLKWQFPITIIYVHFHALWIHCTVKIYFSKKLHTLRDICIYKTWEDWTNQVLLRVLANNVTYRTWKLDHTLKDIPLTNWHGASSQCSIS